MGEAGTGQPGASSWSLGIAAEGKSDQLSVNGMAESMAPLVIHSNYSCTLIDVPRVLRTLGLLRSGEDFPATTGASREVPSVLKDAAPSSR